MDKVTKLYIDDLIKPLVSRIESLERSNEQLRVQVRYLESLMGHQPSYQKPTVSAAHHMRESRISSKDSRVKGPNWCSNTKTDMSPSKVDQLSGDKDKDKHEKVKTKPPIPKVLKSPSKGDSDEQRSGVVEKKIHGGVKIPAAVGGEGKQDKQQVSPLRQAGGQTGTVMQGGQGRQAGLGETGGQSNGAPVGVQAFSNKFQQLVRCNTQLMAQMKQSVQKVRMLSPPSPNLVQKAVSPKSEYNQSVTTSPNSRSFISQSAQKKGVLGLRVDVQCNMAKIELK